MYQNVAGGTAVAGGGATLAHTGGMNSLGMFFTAVAFVAVGYALFHLAPRFRRRRV
jgi:hypothetical protein